EREEVAEHDLDDRPEAGDSRPERSAGERQLRDRRVEDAVGSILVVEAGRRREHAPSDGDVFTEKDHTLVGGELLVEGVANRCAEGDSRHYDTRASGRSISSRRRERKRAPSAP